MFIINCNSTPKDLVLENTWGEDGNWGGKKIVKNTSKPKETPKEETSEEKHNESKEVTEAKDVKNTETPKDNKESEDKTSNESSETSEQTNENTQTEATDDQLTYNDTNYGYSIENVGDWQKRDSFASIGAYFTKSVDDNQFDFSIAAIENLKSENINTVFKNDYIAKLMKKFPSLKVTIDKEQTLKNKKLWTVEFTFDKNGEKIQERQVFIPHKNNVLVMNWVSTEQGFITGENEFNLISEKFVLN